MSDYLNSIVLRSLNLATVVQPRVPQLFEEAPVPLPDTSQQAAITSNPVQESQMFTAPPSQQNAEHSTVILQAATTGEPRSQSPFMLPSPTPAPEVSEAAPATLIASATPDISQPSDIPVASPNLKKQTPAEAEHAASTIRPASETQHEHLSTPRATAHNASIRSQQSQAPTFAPNVSAAPQSMPIRISIGRVDVRAIMPTGPAKAPTATRAKPALSLENYLKQREEGKR